jgi:hypothetical protein
MSSASITVSTRKELYGRKVRRHDKKTGEVHRAIVVDSHFTPDEGPHHPQRVTLLVEDEETGLMLQWDIPGGIRKVEDWDRHPFTITFDKLDVDSTDLASLGIDGGSSGGPSEMFELMHQFNKNNAYARASDKGGKPAIPGVR